MPSGGYDCMTDAFVIRDSEGRTVATLDLKEYGQEPCVSDQTRIPRFNEAKANAHLIAAAGNQPEVYIEIQGGCLAVVRCATPLKVVLIDRDNLKERDEPQPPITDEELEKVPQVY